MIGSQPCFKRNGLMPADLLGVQRIKYRLMGTISAQLPFYSMDLAMMELRVPCIHSTTPLPRGWYGDARTCSIPFVLRNLVNNLLVNCGPLSLTKDTGNPFLQNISFSLSTTTLVVVFFMGTASGHLVAMSMYVKRNWCPPLGHRERSNQVHSHPFGRDGHHLPLQHGQYLGLLFAKLLTFVTRLAVSCDVRCQRGPVKELSEMAHHLFAALMAKLFMS